MQRVTKITSDTSIEPFDVVALDHDERHIRRKVLTLQNGDKVLVDLPRAQQLAHGDRLVLEDGRQAEVVATDEDLMAVTAGPRTSIALLCWHIGNRHLAAQIEPDRILVQRDHVIRVMLLTLGAIVQDVREPFQPERGAYHNHDHSHRDHGHGNHAHGHHGHDHHHD